uniref:Uncharacterized protein LOC114324507 n=1 Tax=Diabrotica virgifera virgifera TaxID=50390 RepID=A0A6P7F2P5_DIAVI
MPSRCCVPECKSNYDSSLKKNEQPESTFLFPKDPKLRELWLQFIHRKNFVIGKSAVVCAKHFYSDDIERVREWVDKEGNKHVEKLTNPKLKPSAVPRIFPHQPKYLTTPQTVERTDPENRRMTINKRHEEVLSEIEQSDMIECFDSLKDSFQIKLSLSNWNYREGSTGLHFFTLNVDTPENADL